MASNKGVASSKTRTKKSSTTQGKGRRWEEDTNPKNSNDESDRRAELKVNENGCFKEGKQSSTRPHEAERSSKIFRSS